jgi:hypothetical protein
MSIRTRLLAILDEVIRLAVLKNTDNLRWTTLVSDRCISQYNVFFRIANGSEGHANVYVVKTEKDGTLVITGQIADCSDGVRVLEYDHDLAFALGRLWLLRNGHLRAVMGDIHHFTADMDSGQLVPTWREGEIHAWKSFPYRAKYISQIEDRFAVVLCDYCGVRAARRCAEPIPAAHTMTLATSIGRPVKCTNVSGRSDPPPKAAVTRWMTLKALWNSGSPIQRAISHRRVGSVALSVYVVRAGFEPHVPSARAADH